MIASCGAIVVGWHPVPRWRWSGTSCFCGPVDLRGQMMRYHTFKILSAVGGGFDVTEEDLVAWANAKVRSSQALRCRCFVCSNALHNVGGGVPGRRIQRGWKQGAVHEGLSRPIAVFRSVLIALA